MKEQVHRDEVARLAGVSSATVSYVVNNGPRPVSPETRAKVLEAVQKLGYRPNAVARNLRRQKTTALGMILPDAQNPFFAEVAQGIEQVALENGYVVIQCHSDFSPKRELQFVETLYVERAAGVLWFPTSSDPEPARRLAEYQIPLVVIDRLVPGFEAPSVVADNFRGAYLATQHLIDCGHTLIGCIARPSDLSHSQQRIQGYLQALRDRGLPIDESLVVRSGYRPEAGRIAALDLIQRSPRPTAMFAYNDFMAIGALRAAYENGLRVPDDLAIVGFDNIPQAALTCPSLTTVSQPKAELGQRAAQLLLDLIEGETPESTQLVLDVELVVRESTRGPRQRTGHSGSEGGDSSAGPDRASIPATVTSDRGSPLRIIVASDQVGFPLKQAVLRHLASSGVEAVDGGPASDERAVDYPDFAGLVGRAIHAGECDRGILICGSGLGMSIAANRLPGIRAALCHDVYTAHMARAHNDANVLCMGAWVVTPQRAVGIVDEWLSTAYEQGRHAPRLVKIERLAREGEGQEPDHPACRARPFRSTVSLSPNRSVFGPLVYAGRLEEGLRAAAAAGFDAVELSLRTPQDIDLPRVHGWLGELGLAVSGIATGQSYLHDSLSFCHPDATVRSACVDRLKSLVPVAAELGAVMILGGVRGKLAGDPATWEAQREGAIGSMREVARYAASQGVQAVIEPINRYETNFINTAAEGLAAIEAIGEPSVKLLLDTFHMNIEEADIPETVRRAGARIGYVHFADSNRRAPGAGHTRFAEILGALAEVGYGGYVGAEILPLPDDRSAVEQAALFLRAQPARAG